MELQKIKNTDVSFSNVEGLNSFSKKKNEANLLTSIEPETAMGFISDNRNGEISDMFYVRYK